MSKKRARAVKMMNAILKSRWDLKSKDSLRLKPKRSIMVQSTTDI